MGRARSAPLRLLPPMGEQFVRELHEMGEGFERGREGPAGAQNLLAHLDRSLVDGQTNDVGGDADDSPVGHIRGGQMGGESEVFEVGGRGHGKGAFLARSAIDGQWVVYYLTKLYHHASS